MPQGMDAVHSIKENLAASMTIAAFFGIAWYIAVEVFILVIFTFSRYNTLYFWSCALSAAGVLLSPIFAILKDFGVWHSKAGTMVTIVFSWWIMVIPQSVMLYSRLHLIMCSMKHLRWVLWMIISTTIFVSIPTVIFSILSRTALLRLGGPYHIWDKLQITIFFIQETIISLVYIFETRKRLAHHDAVAIHNAGQRNVFRSLIYTQIIVIVLDISVQALSFANFFYIANSYKICVYGIKLRIEFSILNRLIESVQGGRHSGSGSARNASAEHHDGAKGVFDGDRRASRMQLDEVDAVSEGSEARILAGTSGIVKTTRIETQTMETHV